ncbi:MAG: preprotein translocase subunit SecE [Nitrospirae bacterium 13_2_20CM_2_63_8]|nr:MAG: preprotein translocase subunit SecE [Nitrospirae bacterium 13_2_20CM_2_63_8]
MFAQTRAALVEFFNDVRSELKKISYPSRSETIGSTTVVIVLVLIVSLFLRLADILISLLIVKIL